MTCVARPRRLSGPDSDVLSQPGASQSYLYSDQQPAKPSSLSALKEALTPGEVRPRYRSPSCFDPPKGDGRPADTVLRLKPGGRIGRGMPVAVLGAGDYTRSEIIPGIAPGTSVAVRRGQP